MDDFRQIDRHVQHWSAGRLKARTGLAAGLLVWCMVQPAAAQQSVTDVLSFLLTNRAIPTADFDRDEQAAATTRDTIARFLVLELGTLPVASSSGGFTYRLDPALGMNIRSSNSFGPFFTERTLTTGNEQASFGFSYRSSVYDSLDGRNLRNGTLVSTASILAGDPQPFDVETVSLRLRTETVTFTANYGASDRFDIGAAVPITRISLSGERVDTYRGTAFLQAQGSAHATGLGDVAVRAKYNLVRAGTGGLAIGGEVRFPTGDEANLLGAGRASVAPRVIASYEGTVVGVHGELAYSFRGAADTVSYGTAVTVATAPRFTVVGEVLGRSIDGVGRLVSSTEPHPRLVGVETIRLTAVEERRNTIVAVAGFKWNVGGTWLLTADVLRPLSRVGLGANWVPTITFDYSFGG